eukprot:gene2526-277_t
MATYLWEVLGEKADREAANNALGNITQPGTPRVARPKDSNCWSSHRADARFYMLHVAKCDPENFKAICRTCKKFLEHGDPTHSRCIFCFLTLEAKNDFSHVA